MEDNLKCERKYCMEEYSALRDEIISISEQLRSTWTTMITLCVSIYILAFETKSSELFLLLYIILIPFQYIINSQQWSVQKISTYIRCFFESKELGIHWETMHIFQPYLDYRKKFGDEIPINAKFPLVLGGLSTGIFIFKKIIELTNKQSISENIFAICFIILSLALFAVLFKVNSRYNARYDGELEKVIMKYKNSIK